MTELIPYAAIQRYEDRVLAVEPRRAANFLLYLIAALFLIAVIWASFTKIDRTVRANGQVIPSAKLQVVSNLEGGVVEAINIKPGDRVQNAFDAIRGDGSVLEQGARVGLTGAVTATVANNSAKGLVRGLTAAVETPGAATQKIMDWAHQPALPS